MGDRGDGGADDGHADESSAECAVDLDELRDGETGRHQADGRYGYLLGQAWFTAWPSLESQMQDQVTYKGAYPLIWHVHEEEADGTLQARARAPGLAGAFAIVHSP